MDDIILDSQENNDNYFNTSLFTKYAIVLIITGVFHQFSVPVIGYLADDFLPIHVSNVYYIISCVTILVNLILTAVVYADMKKLNWISWPIIILTLTSSSIGMCVALAFFLFKKFTITKDTY